MSWADFTDFKVILAKGSEGCLVTDEEFATQYTPVEFGYVVNPDGTTSRVDKDDPTSMGTIKGKSHSEHGITNFEMTVKVDGGVKIGMGTCAWGGDVKINGASAFNTNNGTCWHNDKVNNVAYGHYTGEAGTITIAGGSYTPYVSVEAETVKSNAIAFSKGDVECEGTLLPEGKDVIASESFAIPGNHTLYKDGYTLTGWTDGENTYNVGTSFVPTKDATLTPVFTQNTKSLADRTEAVTVKWDFQTKNGAPTMAYQGNGATGVYVTQATVEGVSIDVKLDFDATSGKIANANWGDWCQMNGGTKFTIPSCKGAKVSIESYSATTTTTIDGQTDYTASGNIVTAEIGNKAETIDIVIGDGSYFRYIQTVLPVVETPGGKLKEADLINTDMSDLSAVSSGDANNLVITTTGSKEDITFTFHNTTVEPAYTNSKFTLTGAMVAQKNGQATITTSAFDNITTVSYVHGATGSNRGWGFRVKGDGDSDWVTLSDAVASPASGATVTVDVNRKNVQLQWYNLADAQNAMMFNLNIKGNIMVYGEEYNVSTAANIAEAGATTIYPAGGTYTEGDEITLTATENFGYDFVNWTNAAGEEVSKEAKFKATVTADETYTANFVKVNTYELAVAIDGGANDYMVSLNPAPVVVEGKKMYEADTKVTLTASENTILTFTNWSDGQTEKEIVYTMDADKSITANYSAIDFIVGWDFMQAGNNSRKADFFAADNDAVTLDMHKADGSIAGWLDKSQFGAGGYEGRPGAVCWVQGADNGDVGHCYWQTKVNAEAFSDIKIITSMVYNYNAYQTYNVEVSTDGENWEKVGSINMTGAKNWADANIALATKYSNQKELYIRWTADKTSKIDGTASKNDGACLGATYILATAKLIDDGTAPKLVSTVPANGADNASANGKIVLTFDEKVKVVENTVATINGIQLKPAVSGKTVTFDYKGLEYSTDYTFTLPANSVADLTDNYITTPISINFQTKTKPAIEKGMYDVIIMLDDENGNEYTAEQLGKQFADAIATANKRADQNKRFRILVPPTTIKIPTYDSDVTVTVELKNGTKVQKTYKEPRTYITGNNISIIGLDYEKTFITNSTPTETFDGAYGPANISEGIGNNDVLQISGTGTYFQGVTIKTGIGDALGRDIAVQDKGNKTIFKEARLWGYQDTYTNNSGNGRTYFEGGVVRGRTDYLCGKADIWFEGVTLQQCGQGGYPIVPSTPKQYGWIFNRCTLTPETSNVTYTLGRPWGSGTPIALLINTTMEVVPGAEGWSEMSGGWPKRFAEYNSMTKNGTPIDLSMRKRTFGNAEKGIHENCNDPILTAAEASEYSIAKVMGADDDWDPTAATEQASAPTNAVYDNGVATWDNSNYVLGWIIFVEDEPLAYVTENTFDIKKFIEDTPAAKAKNAKAFADGNIELKAYVAGVNEMGGVGEKVEILPANPTGIKTSIINGSANASEMFNIAGQKVSKNAKGVVINNGKKVLK